MAIEVRNQDWLAHNATRAYPFIAGTTLADQTGTFVVPNDFLVSCYLAVPTAIVADPSGFYLQTIWASASGYNLVFGYNGEIVAVAAISRANHTRNKAYPLYGRGDYEDATGHIVVGSLASIDKQPPGQFTFNAADTQLEVDCIRPSLRSISSLRCQNGVTVSDPIYGDVRFQAGRNMRITSVFDTEAQEVVITFDAMEGEGLSADCVCIDTTDERVIKTINGVQPDTDGNFRFEATECIDITEVAGGIRFEDSCATPCCGSAELATLVQALETLRNQITTMESKIATLETRTSAMDAAYFASMLGDGGCTEC